MSAIRLRRGMRLPLLLLVDHDGVRGEAQQADRLGVVGRAEQDDGVAVLDEPLHLLLLLEHPGAGAVDDLQAAPLRLGHRLRRDAVGADHDGRARLHLAERLDGVDALRVELGDDAGVVHDLAQRMGPFALGGGQLGVVDRLAHAVAEARALGDEDLFHACHLTFEYGMPPPGDPSRGPG